MANNHALDYGPVGLQDTFGAISASRFPVIGIGRNATEAYRPYRTTIKGQRIAVLTALDWLEPALQPAWSATETRPGLAVSFDPKRLVAAIRQVRPQVDTLVVFLHWGTEQDSCADDEQRSLAWALAAAGADIIVGAHAHRVHGAGRVGKTFIAYGLGNFAWWRGTARTGAPGCWRHRDRPRRRFLFLGAGPDPPRRARPAHRPRGCRRRRGVAAPASMHRRPLPESSCLLSAANQPGSRPVRVAHRSNSTEKKGGTEATSASSVVGTDQRSGRYAVIVASR